MADSTTPKGWTSPNVWAEQAGFEGNPVKQLLVPTSMFASLGGPEDHLSVSNEFGEWPAFAAGHTSPTTGLALKVSIGAKPGDAVGASPTWVGAKDRSTAEAVCTSYDSALSFARETDGSTPSLRTPQLGAVHAVLGYWTTGERSPATVVMPTGTGKTETMLALLVAARPERLLVLVPTDALREQITRKFERLGVLQELGIVSSSAIRPVVGRILHGFTSTEEAGNFAEACNVIIATPQVLEQCKPDARSELLARMSHLFVDEAHHVAARSWSEIRDAFADRPVLQFTATPFREDGLHLGGKMIYSFPLRKAQEQGYFSKINYRGVINLDDTDREVATLAIEQLRKDRAAGLDHVLMARVKNIPRAIDILPLYEELAADLKPVIINSKMSKGGQKAALTSLRDGTSRVIVCVDMLGEGFDMPTLKIAAVHDPRKSLGITLQFIGRFARTSQTVNLGKASVFVARTEMSVDKPLRKLYAENPDWNLVLEDLTSSAVAEQQAVSDFEDGFSSQPDNISIRSLLPKMSTVVYRTPSSTWNPLAVVDLIGEERFLTAPAVALNEPAGVAWFVIEHRENVRWGDLETIEELAYELYVLYFDSERRLLYINSSMLGGTYQEIADTVAGEGASRFIGSTVYRVMADITRLVPTTVGVLDAHNQFRRFSMHVGHDVTESFTKSEAGTKSQTNISGGGYRDGEHVNISASIKGRIWTHAAASSLKAWCNWCDGIGTKLLDDTITIESIIKDFILPAPLDARPDAVLLGIEWPWRARTVSADYLKASLNGKAYSLVDVELLPTDEATTGPFNFTLKTDAWEVKYAGELVDQRIVYKCLDTEEVHVATTNKSVALSEWLHGDGMVFLLTDDQLIEGDLLYKANYDGEPYSKDSLVVMDWTGTDIKVESQGAAKKADSIQARVIKELQDAPEPWDIILDDDGTGEIADVVALRLDSEGLLVRLIHCKYSAEAKPGARVGDLYEVCGQAQKSIIWRKSDMLPFFVNLERRARQKHNRTGVSPFEVGDLKDLYRLQDQAQVLRRRMQITIVQPGLSAAGSQDRHLELLAGAEFYLKSTINAALEVWCSA
jgi:superfamily II DNA or RNA helicase